MTRAREIAAMDEAQRILSGEYGEGSTRLWMSLARGLLSMTRRERALEVWAEERGLVLHETPSEDEERDPSHWRETPSTPFFSYSNIWR